MLAKFRAYRKRKKQDAEWLKRSYQAIEDEYSMPISFGKRRHQL